MRVKDNSYLSEIYLSKNISVCLKGFFAIMVLCHHLSQHSGILSGTLVGSVFQFMGAWAVSMSFFFSGYGLMSSYIIKGRRYVLDFPKKRILPFYFICVLLIGIYSLERLIIGYPLTTRAIFDSFFFFRTVISNGWYLQTILLFYIAFYIIFILPIKDNAKIFTVFIFALAYILVCNLLKLSLTKYEATFSFLFGMIWCKYKKIIDKTFLKHNFFEFIISFCVFVGIMAVFFLNKNQAVKYSSKMFSLVAFNTVAVFAEIIILTVNQKIIHNNILKKIGEISLEIYVFQGFFINLFHSKILYINNAYVYIIAVILCTVILSIIINPLFKSIYLIFSKQKT